VAVEKAIIIAFSTATEYVIIIIITYSESVFVALGVQHAMRIRHIAICGMPDPTIFSLIISSTA
jgi:hypothetical protein